jgi:glycosyltransferase involved in cell wall biosynthesis
VKVAVVFFELDPTIGGVHTFAGDIFAALRSERSSAHEFVYYATAVRGEPPSDVLRIPYTRKERYRRAGIYEFRALQDRAGFLRRFGLRTWFEQSLAEQGVDLVWFATNYTEECDLPFVMTIFDIEHARQPWFPEVSKDGQWEQRHYYYSRYIPKATRVIVPNEAGREQVVHHFHTTSERVLCLGHPTPEFAREAARREPLPRERVDRLGVTGRYLFYPAQFWAHKNHPVLIDALVELAKDGGQSYELALVGADHGQLERVRHLARDTEVEDRVHFLGFVERDDLLALYQHAHALTYVSMFGPENLPPLEAFALGCPVIASDVPGAKEQLGDAALLVPPTDPMRVADAVRRLEDPVLRSELAEKGRKRAEGRTAAAFVRSVLDFIDDFERVRRCWG